MELSCKMGACNDENVPVKLNSAINNSLHGKKNKPNSFITKGISKLKLVS
jgi:hypothetical protein